MSRLQVSEVFYSIQGEGASCGRAAVFLRLAGCTLGCTWCDTKYAWAGGTSWDLPEIVARLEAFPARRLVLTGGEPFEQDIAPLLRTLRQRGWTIEIETAAFAPLHQVRCATLAHQLNVSPKLANAGVAEARRLQLPVLRFLRDTGKAYFKFVVSRPDDLGAVNALVETLALPADRVLLMPEGVTAEAVLDTSRWLIELCKRHGYGYSPRLHILLWGARRGV